MQNEATEIIAKFNIDFENPDDGYDFENRVHGKITESYELGRQEVIDELVEWFKPSKAVLSKHEYNAIMCKLNLLKEKK